MMHDEDRADFRQVLGDELDLLDQLRDNSAASQQDDVYKKAQDYDLVGLAFSGGGIRSATFNLGVIQALARYRLLTRFDYLSTVSGGGYIGSWLSALLHRGATDDGTVNQQAVEKFQSCLRPHPEERCQDELARTAGFPPVEHAAVRYLRRYSNYLTPRLGLSGDMFAVVSIFLRNLTLIQLALVSLVASILLLAHFIAASSMVYAQGVMPWALDVLRNSDALLTTDWKAWLQWSGMLGVFGGPYVASALALFVSVWWTGRLMVSRKLHDGAITSTSLVVHYSVILPCMLAAWWFAVAVVTHPELSLAGAGPEWQAVAWITIPAICYTGAWLLGYYARRRSVTVSDSSGAVTLIVSTVLTGVILGVLLYAIHCYIRNISSTGAIDIWHATGFGTPLSLLLLSFVVTLHIGMMRRSFSEENREWLARLGGFILFYAAGWALIFSLVLYATPFVTWLAGGGLVALVTWAAGSGLGAKLARGPASGSESDSGGWKGVIALIAPWLFVAGLAIIVTYGLQFVLFKFMLANAYAKSPAADFGIAVVNTLQQLQALPAAGVLSAFVGAAIMFVLISWRLDINLFSLHALYCNRLARAYLGASRAGDREPNPFTGFDVRDDLPFSDIARQRPIHIINTAINMTGGDDLAWQTRRAASFSFTPVWSGYEAISSQGIRLGAYRRTRDYADGRSMGTWVAVSGAAASPNMGYHTSAAVSALMTAFNLRLGRWCGNPDPVDKTSTVWKQRSPCFSAQPILSELTGSANTRADWVNLTDGGHFENLGVYELVRRRCRLIVVTDAGCDPKHQFEDLANVQRKCWTDFGVNLRFENFEAMHLKKKSRYCGAYGAIGRIQYNDGGEDGAIIYLKASMTGNEWPDIRQYADCHSDFPHETTADQFFDENQFESYRHLGYKVVASVVEVLGKLLDDEKQQALDEIPVADLVDVLLKNSRIFEVKPGD